MEGECQEIYFCPQFFRHHHLTPIVPGKLLSSHSIYDQDLFVVPFQSSCWMQFDSVSSVFFVALLLTLLTLDAHSLSVRCVKVELCKAW